MAALKNGSCSRDGTTQITRVKLAVFRDEPTDLDSASQEQQHDVLLNTIRSAQMQRILLKARKGSCHKDWSL